MLRIAWPTLIAVVVLGTSSVHAGVELAGLHEAASLAETENDGGDGESTLDADADGDGFTLGVRNREALAGERLPASSPASAWTGPEPRQDAPVFRANHGIKSWWQNSSTTVKVWSIIGFVVVVGISAAAL